MTAFWIYASSLKKIKMRICYDANKTFLRAACKWLLVAVILIGMVGVLQVGSVKFKNINRYTTCDVKYADGSTAHFDDKNFGIVNNGDVVTLHIQLPKHPYFENSTLAFCNSDAVTEVWCGNTLLSSYGEDIAAKGRMIGRHDFLIAVPDIAWGNEISIILRATDDRAFSDFDGIKIYPAENVYQYYFEDNPIDLVVSLSLLVFGMIGLAGVLLSKLRKENLRNGIFIAFTALLVSFWMIASKGIYNIFGFTSYFWQPFRYISGYAMPIPMLLFYTGLAEKKSEWKKWFKIFAGIIIAFLVISVVLNYSNIVHFDALANVACIASILSGLLMLSYTISIKPGKHSANILLKTGLHFFVGACVYEVLIRNLYHVIPLGFLHDLPSLISICILSWVVCMIGAFCSDLNDKQKDLLTSEVKANTLKEVIDATPVGICQLIPDEKCTIVSANNRFYKIIGYKDSELEAEKPSDAFIRLFNNDETLLHEKIAEITKGHEGRGEFEFSTTNIEKKPMTLLLQYFFDRDGSGNITVSLLDISERKRIEDDLRINSEEYRLAIEASDHYYFNYDSVTKTCTHMFDSEELFGISEKVGNLPESLVERGLCAPESIDDYRRAFKMFNDGVPRGDFCLHLQNIKKHTYRWYSGNYRTVFDSNGAPLHAVVAFKDITEQREKEIAYNIHKQQIESHPEDEINYFELNLTTGICSYSYGTQAKQLSKKSLLSWNDMLKYMVQNFVHPEDRASIIELLNTDHLLEIYDKGKTNVVREYRSYMPDGSVRWLQASVSITSDERTHEVRAYCVTEDIEEEKAKELERQLELQRSRYYEDAYEKLASSIMYGVCKYSADDDLTIIFANDIFYQMHGYTSQEEAVAAGFTSILFATPPFGKDLVRAAHREYTEGKAGQLFETEYPTIDADGNRIWILCRGIYSPEEGIFNSSVLNITDRKSTEEQLRVSEERYRLALSQSGKVFFFFDVPSRTMHLSEELAQAFSLPTEVDNMPENLISQGLIEPQSIEKYRQFYEEIYAGNPNGKTVISCHTLSAPDQVFWYEITFTSVFNARGVPQSAVITYEDLQEERKNKIAGAWKQLNLVSIPESKYVVTEYNLTQNRLISQEGGLFAKMPEFMTEYDAINDFVLDHFIYEDDIAEYKQFLDRSRVLSMFKEGKTEDSVEYRSLQTGSSPRWTSTSIQMIEDSYSGDVLAQLLFMDIHTEKSGQIEMSHNIEELKKELENSRIKVMINQMQPHFLYNALSAIQTIVKTDPDYAYRLIYDFTVHLRSSIKALSSDTPIPFTDELKNIKAYLNIEQMRFGDSLEVNYEIDCDHFSVIPLSIQPLAENAARHGVYPKGQEGGTVTIRTYETVSAYVVEVEDDGVGFNLNEVLSKDGDSVGLKSLIFRLKSLMNADVAINSKLGVGTKATVTIPKEEA